MKLWWLADLARLSEEKRAVESLEGSGWFELDRWKVIQGGLAAEGVIIAHGVRYPIRLIYPDQFPQVPAWVEPQEKVKLSNHQYGPGGSLCLELRSDNWLSNYTGADVLRSAHKLLSVENTPGEGETVPSAHHVGEVQSYSWSAEPVIIGAKCWERIRASQIADVKALRWFNQDQVWPIMVHDADDRASSRPPPASDILNGRYEIPVYTSLNAAPIITTDREALFAGSEFSPPVSDEIRQNKGAALVLFAGAPDPVAFHMLDGGGNVFRRKVYLLPSQSGVRSGRAADADKKRVAIIGAGSVGSKLAESVARSGVKNLVLVDGDVLLPDNLERHALFWRDVGYRKVRGLKRLLLEASPGANVEVYDQNLNWQVSARNQSIVVSAIAAADVIVDATGDISTALFLGAIAAENGKPFVSIEVFEGGIGFLVATCIPSRDPPFVFARAAFLAWCEQQGAPPPEPGPGAYEAISSEGLPLVADDAAATATVGHAARVVLDILDGCPPGNEAAWLMVGLKKAWIFEGHGHAVRMNVGVSTPQPTAVPDEGAKEFALALLKEPVDANSNPK